MNIADLVHSTVKHNYNAGPSILPKEVFEEASHAILDFNNTGLSILEIGHRTKLSNQNFSEQDLKEFEELNKLWGGRPMDDDH